MSSDASNGYDAKPVASPSSLPKADESVPAPIDWHKKATLIFLASVGATLLVTGATGSRMMKKPPSVKSPTPVASTSTSPAAACSSVKRLPRSTSSQAPMRRSSSKLRALFQSSASSSTTTLDFRANQHSAWAKELPVPAMLGSMSEADDPAAADIPPELQFSAALDALKAFTLATAMTVGSTALGVYLLARYLGANDIPSFMHGLRHEIMQPFAKSVSQSDFLPNWLKLKERPRSAESIRSEQEDEEELREIWEKGWRDFVKQTGLKANTNDTEEQAPSTIEVQRP